MGHGSGFVISENLILTNHHVVGESNSVAIKFSNGLQLIGKVIASNLGRDVAVVKVDATLPKYFRLSRNTPVLGADVYAIGTPLDEKLHSTISRGIISALRVVQNKTLIQSDINIHPGSSGGPLLYKSGTVVGIAVSKFAVNKTSQGISFFIPIDDALKSLEVI
jgi:S1-C subfamily serine protease